MSGGFIIANAIKKINSDAQFTITGNDINTCTIIWLENTTPISKEDIKVQIPTVEAEIEQEKQNAVNKKASGKQKLKDLGLDDDEIQALIGV